MTENKLVSLGLFISPYLYRGYNVITTLKLLDRQKSVVIVVDVLDKKSS